MGRQYRILHVEDSLTQRMLMREALEDSGWEVVSVESAEQALHVLSRSVPDLILLDYMMPGMRGDELCRRIRMNVNTRTLPILMLTADDGFGGERQGLDSGADGFLSKSVEVEQLLSRMKSMLSKSPLQSTVFRPDESGLRQARVLLIEHSSTYLHALADVLEQEEGYALELATNGQQGLELMDSHQFDAVLVTLELPEMDGLEVCRQLAARRLERAGNYVIMMLTSRDGDDDMTRGLEAGADDFISKSGDMSILKARIRAMLRRKFFQEENSRIQDEFKTKEVEASAARALAEARAAAADELRQKNDELKLAHEQLQAAQVHLVQSEKMASLGQLVAGIAHEINNPLAFASNNIYNLQNWVEKLSPEVEPTLPPPSLQIWGKLRTRLEDARTGVERVKQLVLQLRTFSRQDQCEFETVNIHESLDAVLQFCHHRLHGIEVTREYRFDGQLTCFASQLNQVFMNLISNAIDAVGESGKILVRTEQTEDCVRIVVRDSGPGLSDQARQRIFEPFFTTKPIGKGTGLGLAISYQIVQTHNGKITVESEPGQGCQFSVEIPLELQRAETPAPLFATPGSIASSV